jgi:hypothetical protein
MTPKQKQFVSDAVLRLLQRDYRTDFQPIYACAVQVLGRPITDANEEIHLIQNHCAEALAVNDFDEAELHTARARRHLQHAKYVCLTRIFVRQFRYATKQIRDIERLKAASVELARAQLTALQRERRSIPIAKVQQRDTLAQIESDIDAAIVVNEKLEVIGTEINKLIEHLEINFPIMIDKVPDGNTEAPDQGQIDPNEFAGKSVENGGTANVKARKAPVTRLRTGIGRAVVEHKEQLALSVSALLLLIEAKILELRRQLGQLPNDPDTIKAVDDEIAHFEEILTKLRSVGDDASAVAEGQSEEAKVVESANTFAEGIRSWWIKRHEQICQRSFEMGLFVSAVGVCTLVGAGGWPSIAIAGVLAGGKPVADVVKSIGKSITSRKGTVSKLMQDAS